MCLHACSPINVTTRLISLILYVTHPSIDDSYLRNSRLWISYTLLIGTSVMSLLVRFVSLLILYLQELHRFLYVPPVTPTSTRTTLLYL